MPFGGNISRHTLKYVEIHGPSIQQHAISYILVEIPKKHADLSVSRMEI